MDGDRGLRAVGIVDQYRDWSTPAALVCLIRVYKQFQDSKQFGYAAQAKRCCACSICAAFR